MVQMLRDEGGGGSEGARRWQLTSVVEELELWPRERVACEGQDDDTGSPGQHSKQVPETMAANVTARWWQIS